MKAGAVEGGAGGPHYALVRILAEATTLPDAAMRLSELMARHFGWEMAGLWMVDEAAGVLRYAGGWSEGDDDLVAFRRISERLTFARGIGLPGSVWQTGEAAWIEDVSTAPNFPRVDVASQLKLRGAVALPLTSGSRVLGVMELLSREVRRPDAAQLDFLRAVGREVGQYVARVSAEERLHASEEMSASIVRAALDCIVTMDHEGRITDFNPAAETTFGYARDDVVGRRLADTIIPPDLREAHQRALQRYLETREGRILNRRLELDGARADGTSFPVELTVTRLGRREPPVFGGFIRDITERRRAEDEVAGLLEREHAARIRAEEAERFERTVAETLQRGLLPPQLPVVPGVALGAAYRAGGVGTLVGGDFYDVFELSGGRWGVAIGDVRGKGAEAASVTAMMRWTIRSAALREHSPSRVLEALNTVLLSATTPGDTGTAIYACLETDRDPKTLTLAVAGHPTPLRMSAGGDVAAVGETGTMLGALSQPELHDTAVALSPGDVLLLYTDGVTESRTPEGFFGPDRLAAALRATRGADAPDVARSVEAAVTEAAGGRLTDDVALLVIAALAPRDD
jgi:phosphoserine phosphatase RsbU/P